MQFTPRELLQMFARKESVTTLLIWGAIIFYIRPFEAAAGYPLETRVLLWGSLLPLLFGIYLVSLIAMGRAFTTGYSVFAHLASALSGGILLPVAQRLLGDEVRALFNMRAFVFTLIASMLLEMVMATYLSYDKRLREERRARAVAETALRAKASPEPPASISEPEPKVPEASEEAPPATSERPVALLGRAVLLSQLQLISAEEHYVRLHTTTGQDLVRGRISDLEAQLPQELGLRVHRSHWVATTAVRRLHRSREAWVLELIDGTEIPVARPRRESVREWLLKAGLPI